MHLLRTTIMAAWIDRSPSTWSSRPAGKNAPHRQRFRPGDSDHTPPPYLPSLLSDHPTRSLRAGCPDPLPTIYIAPRQWAWPGWAGRRIAPPPSPFQRSRSGSLTHTHDSGDRDRPDRFGTTGPQTGPDPPPPAERPADATWAPRECDPPTPTPYPVPDAGPP